GPEEPTPGRRSRATVTLAASDRPRGSGARGPAGRERPLAMSAQGRMSRRRWIDWYGTTAAVALWDVLSPCRPAGRPPNPRAARVPRGSSSPAESPTASSGRRSPTPECFRENFRSLLELLRVARSTRVLAERLPLTETRREHEMLGVRRRRESSCPCHSP